MMVMVMLVVTVTVIKSVILAPQIVAQLVVV